VDEIECDKVIINDSEGAKKAVQHLVDIGCKRIAIITTVDYVSVGKLRTIGYREALENNGIPVDENLILKIEDVENSDEEINRFLFRNEVDGIFAVNEQFSVSAIRDLNNRGLKVPEDVSVVGFTNGELSKRFIPSLTTVSQHGAQMGAKAANLLIDKLENPVAGEEKYSTEIIETSLIERESTLLNLPLKI